MNRWIRFIFHPCMVGILAMSCFEPIQIAIIAAMVLSAQVYFYDY